MNCFVVLLSIVLLQPPAGDETSRETTVGMPIRLDQVVLPGPELEAKPLEDRRSPIVLRVAAVYPHGTDHRYDLVAYALEPGDYNLVDFMLRRDGSAITGVPPLTIHVAPALPPGQVEPHQPGTTAIPALGGYTVWWIVGSLLWFVGLVLILTVGRRRKNDSVGSEATPLSLADRLRPIVQRAMAGTMSDSEKAELERTLLSFWRRRLQLQDLKANEAMVALRQHPQAGQLLKQLEVWLHQPPDKRSENEIDVAALLEPYRDLPSEDVAGEPGWDAASQARPARQSPDQDHTANAQP